MTECVLIFDADVTPEEINAIFSDNLPGNAVPIYQNSYQLGVDASYSAIKHAICSAFPQTPFALAKTKEGKMFFNNP